MLDPKLFGLSSTLNLRIYIFQRALTFYLPGLRNILCFLLRILRIQVLDTLQEPCYYTVLSECIHIRKGTPNTYMASDSLPENPNNYVYNLPCALHLNGILGKQHKA